MKAIIVAGGDPPTKKLLKSELTKDSVIIAADSGANCLFKYKIIPKYLIGDFDSVNKKILSSWTNKNIIIEQHPSQKNLTDAELALKKAIELKAYEIVFLGCLGGNRVDHLLGALGLLTTCLKKNIEAYIKDEHQTITLIKKPTITHGKPGQTFSLQAYGGTVKGLTISGSKYPLSNYTLKPGDSLTLSNQYKNKRVKLDFIRGKLLLITHRFKPSLTK